MGKRFFLTFLFCFVFVGSSFAVPNFSRQTGEKCSYCHTNWPQLNSYGKMFKLKGFPGLRSSISQNKAPSFGARINYRLIDKRTAKNSKDYDVAAKERQLKIRGLHEVEVFIAGAEKTNIGRVSYFVEIEFEDEFPEYEGRVVHGYVNAAIHPLFNVSAGMMNPFQWDGNNTVSRSNAVRYKWKSRGFALPTSQAISIHGYMGNLTYGFAYHGNKGDLEGHDPQGRSFRAAYTLFNVLSVGGFVSKNQVYDGDVGRSVGVDDRSGIDFNLEVGDFSAQTMFITKRNNKGYEHIQSYSLNYDSDLFSVTSVYDSYTKNGGDWGTGGFFVSFFAAENFKIQIGAEGTLMSPSEYQHQERRFTLALDLGI